MPKEIIPLFAPSVTFTRTEPKANWRFELYTDDMLHTYLQKAIEKEEYEEAIKYRDELKKRKAN